MHAEDCKNQKRNINYSAQCVSVKADYLNVMIMRCNVMQGPFYIGN